MKILELPSYFLPNKGGIEYCVYYLGKEMVKQGNKVTVVSSDINSDVPEETMENIQVKRVKSFTFLKTPMSFKLKRTLMKEDFDVMHLHYPHPIFLDIAAKVAQKRGKPYVVHCHGKEIELKGLIGILGNIYNKLFFDKVLKNASKIITNTSKVIPQSKYLTKYKDKVVTIPHGVDIDSFRKVPTELKKELGLENNKIIMYAGALRWYKGLEYLIRAHAKIIRQVPEAKLLIIGKGEEEKKLRKLAKELHLEDNILFQGFVDAKKLIEYYSIADMFVLASPNIEESFGLVAIEALSMGIPTMVTEGAGVSEVFDEEGIGIVVPPESSRDIAIKAVELLKDPKKLKDVGEIGKHVVTNKYKWSDIAAKYVDVFRDITKNDTDSR